MGVLDLFENKEEVSILSSLFTKVIIYNSINEILNPLNEKIFSCNSLKKCRTEEILICLFLISIHNGTYTQ